MSAQSSGTKIPPYSFQAVTIERQEKLCKEDAERRHPGLFVLYLIQGGTVTFHGKNEDRTKIVPSAAPAKSVTAARNAFLLVAPKTIGTIEWFQPFSSQDPLHLPS